MKDWTGEWFKIFADLMHEPQEASLCALDLSTNTILVKKRVSHAEHDGFHGTTTILKNEGYDETSFPALKPLVRPSMLKQFLGFLRHASFNAKPRKVAWKNQDFEKKLPSDLLSWKVFSKEETESLLIKARQHNISTNSLLLWSLHSSVPTLLKKEISSDVWMIPVNLRGALSNSYHQGNQVSFIGIELEPQVSPQDVHQKIKQTFKLNYHWGSWWLLNIGKIIGVAGMRWLAREQMKMGISWIGSLSNMGVWNPPLRNIPNDENIAWFSCPPMSAYQCLATCAVIWRGQLILSMDIHPSVTTDRKILTSCLEAWSARLLS